MLFCRVRTLGIAFRYWANITKLDRQAEGTLSPHTFAILLIYYLQRIHQVREKYWHLVFEEHTNGQSKAEARPPP